MISKKYDIFSKVSLAVVGFYCIANTLLIVGWGPKFGGLLLKVYMFLADIILFIDLSTWHIFFLFAAISFVVKIALLCKGKSAFKGTLFNLIFHLLFSIVSVAEIYWIFENSF